MRALPLATGLALAFSTLAAPAAAAPCGFSLGFKALHDRIPDVVGSCLVDEHHNPANGDGLQETSGGLLVWRKADNFTAFTDGYRSWVSGPYGVQERLNTESFDWERAAAPASRPRAGGRRRRDAPGRVHRPPTPTGYAICGPGLAWNGSFCANPQPPPRPPDYHGGPCPNGVLAPVVPPAPPMTDLTPDELAYFEGLRDDPARRDAFLRAEKAAWEARRGLDDELEAFRRFFDADSRP
jgi:hypothetical protein